MAYLVYIWTYKSTIQFMANQTTIQTPLKTVIQDYEAGTKSKFRPTKDFYESMEINRIRFWQLVKGKQEPKASEILALSKFFNVPFNQLITNEKARN
ncbi:hypothetical protein [Salmonirosea aquatica]|uniref:HTH cro/C1-type domain-containing protein n=1 Tax=Salmonirosea aquatica TaxID=2654236 RepID=A0A7C9F7A9_9BACT|nr:hypothetical protein [Cytophagaceae bacterium SJW1-29]